MWNRDVVKLAQPGCLMNDSREMGMLHILKRVKKTGLYLACRFELHQGNVLSHR